MARAAGFGMLFLPNGISTKTKGKYSRYSMKITLYLHIPNINDYDKKRPKYLKLNNLPLIVKQLTKWCIHARIMLEELL